MIQPPPTDQPMMERMSLLRCGRCNWPIGRVNLDLPTEQMLQCNNCKKDQDGTKIRTYNVTRVIVVYREQRAS
jgi:hypothetical protein